jgi:hypothetical protein
MGAPAEPPDVAAVVAEAVGARMDAARRRREALAAFYADKRARRDAGLAARHRAKLARLAAEKEQEEA